MVAGHVILTVRKKRAEGFKPNFMYDEGCFPIDKQAVLLKIDTETPTRLKEQGPTPGLSGINDHGRNAGPLTPLAKEATSMCFVLH